VPAEILTRLTWPYFFNGTTLRQRFEVQVLFGHCRLVVVAQVEIINPGANASEVSLTIGFLARYNSSVLTRKVRFWVIISAVWAIVTFVAAINLATNRTPSIKAELGLEAYEYLLNLHRFVSVFVIIGVLPVIGWGAWWIRRV
jgi:hypothetical protein